MELLYGIPHQYVYLHQWRMQDFYKGVVLKFDVIFSRAVIFAELLGGIFFILSPAYAPDLHHLYKTYVKH